MTSLNTITFQSFVGIFSLVFTHERYIILHIYVTNVF